MTQSVGWAELDLPLKLNIQAAHLSEEQFLQICQENPELPGFVLHVRELW